MVPVLLLAGAAGLITAGAAAVTRRRRDTGRAGPAARHRTGFRRNRSIDDPGLLAAALLARVISPLATSAARAISRAESASGRVNRLARVASDRRTELDELRTRSEQLAGSAGTSPVGRVMAKAAILAVEIGLGIGAMRLANMPSPADLGLGISMAAAGFFGGTIAGQGARRLELIEAGELPEGFRAGARRRVQVGVAAIGLFIVASGGAQIVAASLAPEHRVPTAAALAISLAAIGAAVATFTLEQKFDPAAARERELHRTISRRLRQAERASAAADKKAERAHDSLGDAMSDAEVRAAALVVGRDELAARLSWPDALDVGAVKGMNELVGSLPTRLAEIAADRPVAVHHLQVQAAAAESTAVA